MISPDRSGGLAELYISDRTSHETAFSFRLFARVRHEQHRQPGNSLKSTVTWNGQSRQLAPTSSLCRMSLIN